MRVRNLGGTLFGGTKMGLLSSGNRSSLIDDLVAAKPRIEVFFFLEPIVGGLFATMMICRIPN